MTIGVPAGTREMKSDGSSKSASFFKASAGTLRVDVESSSTDSSSGLSSALRESSAPKLLRADQTRRCSSLVEIATGGISSTLPSGATNQANRVSAACK